MPERAYSSDAPLYWSAESGTAANAVANSPRATKKSCRSVSRWASRGSLINAMLRLAARARGSISLRSTSGGSDLLALKSAAYSNRHVVSWVNEMAKMCKPDRIYWCDGSEGEAKELLEESVET